jgi:16S rRNA (uracil1498-N3)-methyltransferase
MARSPYRFYSPQKLPSTPGETIDLPVGESHHLAQVLRLRAQAEVVVFDSRGAAWLAEVTRADPRGAKLRMIEKIEAGEGSAPPRPRLHLAVSLLKPRATDWMIEKLCELDVATLQPLLCKRTVVRPKVESAPEPPARWQRIALAAAKQSGRNQPMAFYPVTPLGAWLQRERPPALRCFAHATRDATPLGEWLGGRAGLGLPVQVAVGPEGGFTAGEVELFIAAGILPVSLGPLVMRAETAAITIAAACRVMI